MNAAETEKHDRLYARAVALLQSEIPSDGAPLPAKPHFFVRRRLDTALALFEEVLRMAPDNWAAMFGAAKVYQRLGNLPAALDLIEAAQRGDPVSSRYAQEATLLATQLGRPREGIE
jgi:tetratricopeptide (TPR) repeat protein